MPTVKLPMANTNRSTNKHHKIIDVPVNDFMVNDFVELFNSGIHQLEINDGK